MELEHLSPSRIGTFDQCQGKYHAQYVEGLRGTSHPLTFMGSCVHFMFECATNCYLGQEGFPSTDPFHYLDEAVEQEHVEKKLVSLVKKLTQNGLDWGYFRRVDRCIGAEVGFDIVLPDKTPVVGFIDRLDAWRDGGDIIDLKTQKRAFEAETLHKNWQARVYNMAGRHLVESMTGKVKVSFWVLRHQVQPVWLTADDSKRTIDDLMAKADEIRSVKEPSYKPSGLCPWCPRYETCQAAKEGISKRFKRKMKT